MNEEIGDVRDDVSEAIEKRRVFNKFHESLKALPQEEKQQLLAVLENVEDTLSQKGKLDEASLLNRTLEVGGSVAVIAGGILFYLGSGGAGLFLVNAVGLPAMALGGGENAESLKVTNRKKRLETLRQALSS